MSVIWKERVVEKGPEDRKQHQPIEQGLKEEVRYAFSSMLSQSSLEEFMSNPCHKRKTSAFRNIMLPFFHYCIVSVRYLLKVKNLIFSYMYLIKTPRQTLRSGKSTELFIFLDIEIKIYFGSGKRKIFEIPWGIKVCLRALSFYTCQKFDFFPSLLYILVAWKTSKQLPVVSSQRTRRKKTYFTT